MLPSEEIKEKINIVDLINEYVPLKKAGVNFRALCPFHQEKTPSFIVSPTKQIWHCFGCGNGGDIFEFIKQIEGVEFPEALRILASRAGVTLTRPTIEYKQEQDQKNTLLAINELAAKFYAKILSDSPLAQIARDYVQKRGFKPETIAQWGLGYAPSDFHIFENFIVKKGYQKKEAVAAGLLVEKEEGPVLSAEQRFFDRFRGRLMFPLFDLHGRVVGFTGRILDESPLSAQGGSGTIPAKYVNSPETLIYSKGQLIYGLNFAKTEIRKKGEVIAVEGNIDVITCHEAGFTNVVGSSGTALTQRQLEILERYSSNISFAFDVDDAGLLATRRAVELALSLGFNVKIISLPKALAKDPDELVRRDPALWEAQVAGAQSFLDFYFSSLFANIDASSSAIEKKQAVAELLPLLSLLPHPLDRAHYVQKLAAKIAVDQKIILDLVNKHRAARESSSGVTTEKKPRVSLNRPSKQEVLERRVLGLFLKSAKDLQAEWGSLSEQDFSTAVLREFFAVVAPIVGTGKFDLENFFWQYPKWKSEIELLIFGVENELSLLSDVNLENFCRQLFAELKQATARRRMRELSFLIQEAEREGRAEEVKAFSAEFNDLTRELNKYHA